MAQMEYIKHLYEVEGSLREIAKTLHINFRTVQKYAYRNDWNPPVKPNTSPADFPVLGAYIPVIDEWLMQDEREPPQTTTHHNAHIRTFTCGARVHWQLLGCKTICEPQEGADAEIL